MHQITNKQTTQLTSSRIAYLTPTSTSALLKALNWNSQLLYHTHSDTHIHTVGKYNALSFECWCVCAVFGYPQHFCVLLQQSQCTAMWPPATVIVFALQLLNNANIDFNNAALPHDMLFFEFSVLASICQREFAFDFGCLWRCREWLSRHHRQHVDTAVKCFSCVGCCRRSCVAAIIVSPIEARTSLTPTAAADARSRPGRSVSSSTMRLLCCA